MATLPPTVVTLATVLLDLLIGNVSPMECGVDQLQSAKLVSFKLIMMNACMQSIGYTVFPLVQCPSLTNFTNGAVIVTRRTVGGRAIYFCNFGYSLNGSSSRTCQSNGVWSGSAPICQVGEFICREM